MELPIVCTSRVEWAERPQKDQNTVLITGAAGTLGTIASRILFGVHRLISYDLVEPDNPALYDEVIIGNVADRELLIETTLRADYVLHFSAGAPQGWAGLSDSEISGSRNVIDAAMNAGVKRLVLATSNHVAGWYELDQLAGVGTSKYIHGSPLRPDGLYAASKVFVEALGRSAAEYSGLGVSVLRVGTMRLLDDPHALAHDPAFAYIGTPSDITARMERTWLYHDDFAAMLHEEMQSTETFRVRFAISGTESAWATDVDKWDR